MKKFKKKLFSYMSVVREKMIEYISTNRLFITYVLLAITITILTRYYTIGNPFDLKPIVIDTALILLIGAFGYLFKPKNQFYYYISWLTVFTLMGLINTIYFKFYVNFASFSLITTISQIGEVQGSLFEKLNVIDFIYIIFPMFFYYIHRMLRTSTYYNMVSKIENGHNLMSKTIIVSAVMLAMSVATFTGTDYSRLAKQWNREYVVERFGIVMYQGNDLIQSLAPKINALFGYEEAAIKFKDFFSKEFALNESKDLTNKYTDVFDGKNLVLVHMESIQTTFVDMVINDQEITPYLNELTKDGMYFSDFFPQISTGTSADTEFTLNTSLMPALSGIAFVSYTDRGYVSIENQLTEKGYYTFSSHGNNPSMWNRNKMHPALGYQDMFFKDSFVVTEENSIGLGISDQEYFNQLKPILENIDMTYDSYMGTLITLSNHSPFTDTTLGTPELYNTYGTLDLTNTYTVIDEETGLETEVVDDFISDKKLGKYMQSVYYADQALGEFMEYVENSEYYDDTVFVFYGDHDAKLSAKEYEYFYNYNYETGELYTEEDEEYYNYGIYEHDINRRTPLIIWTKDDTLRKRIRGEVTYTTGMYDVMPTLGNMFGFSNSFAMGHDIFETKEDNVVIFPNGDFVTNKAFYDNSESSHYVRREGELIEDGYIEGLIEYTDIRLDISNSILVHDLIAREGKSIPKYSGDLLDE